MRSSSASTNMPRTRTWTPFRSPRSEPVPRLTRACPMLPAPDVAAAADWYRDSLGFAVRFVLADYAIVERDGIELHLWTCDERRIAEHTSAYTGSTASRRSASVCPRSREEGASAPSRRGPGAYVSST